MVCQSGRRFFAVSAGARTTLGHFWLETFNNPEEAAHMYDAACWHFSRGRDCLNFPDVQSREEAKFLAPPRTCRCGRTRRVTSARN
jgi:hypothetical protein